MSSFHLTCAFIGALGKKMRCSGFEEVLIESGICASGLIEQVLTGKHYNHALRAHKVFYKALERILLWSTNRCMDVFLISEGLQYWTI